MDLRNWKQHYRSLKTEAGLSRIALAGSGLALAVLAFMALNQEKIVVIQPWTLQRAGWVGQDSASQSYKEAWGLALAQMLGNVNAGNLKFISERLGPLLPLEIYQDYMTTLTAQASQLEENRITTRFEPSRIVYEKSSDKVFVYGKYYTKSPGIREQKSERTYEFVIGMDAYLPQVMSIDTYEDEPRTERRLETLRRRAEKTKDQKKD